MYNTIAAEAVCQNWTNRNALEGSFVTRPSHLHANIHTRIFFTIQKAGRSGRFSDVMVMSHGRGLNIHGCGLNFLNTHRSLPTLGTQSAFSSFAHARSLTSICDCYQKLVRSSQVLKLELRESSTGLKTRVNWCMWTGKTRAGSDYP